MIAPLVVFAACVAAAFFWGRSAMRVLVAVAVILAGVRGGLLVLASDVGLGNPGLAVNALVPAIVAAIVIGVILRLRPRLSEFSRPLLVGWCLIALVAIVNLSVQLVGLKLYAIGLAQYLVYPTLALIIWPLMEEGDERRLSRTILAAGLIVAGTVMLQAADLESFIQEANSTVDGLAANRYAGITGSYLHTSAFLGCSFVLMMAELIDLRTWARRLAGGALLVWIFTAVILTFSRSGVMISAIGLVVLLIFAARNHRVAFLAVVIPAVAVAVGLGTLGGVTPGEAGNRAASGLKTEGDAGNDLRSEAITDGINRYGDATVVNKVLGDGLASTGNARKIADTGAETDESNIVESYYLKILTETGVFGMILIGGFMVWSLVHFCWTLFRFPDPQAAGLAAAGLGLGLYNVIYPALETQLLALTWWLILSISLRRTALAGDRPLWPFGGGGVTEPDPGSAS